MLTVFWSPVSGQAGTTTIFCAAAAYLERKEIHRKTLFLRTKFKPLRLTDILRGKEAKRFGNNPAGQPYQNSCGIDQLMMARASGMSLASMLPNQTYLLDDNLELLEGSRQLHREVYEKELEESLPSIIRAAKDIYEDIFLEAENGATNSNEALFSEADRIYVCLPQNLFVLEEYFRNKKAEEKYRYLLGNYDADSILNRHNLSRRFHGKGTFAAFPYLTAVKDAYSAGELEDYILQSGTKKTGGAAGEKVMLETLQQITSH